MAQNYQFGQTFDLAGEMLTETYQSGTKISTGYGQAQIGRGWGRWGEEPFTDVMDATDAALKRPDLDTSRTGLMGGSFGGYMAN